MWQLECIFPGSFPSARHHLTGSTEHWHSCAWTPATADNIAVSMWSEQLARLLSCLSPCHKMCLWSSSALERSPQPFCRALGGQVYYVARLLCLPKQTMCKGLGSRSTGNRGIGVQRQGNKHLQQRAEINSKWRPEVCCPHWMPASCQVWWKRHLWADDGVGTRGLEELGVGLLLEQRCLCLLCNAIGAGLGNNRALCLADVQAAFAFFSWGQLKHRERTDLICTRVSGVSASQVTNDLAKVMQQVSDAVRDRWKSLCGCFSLMVTAQHLH